MGKYTGVLLCSDFDGTLFDGKVIPEENIKAIKYFRENGGLFSVVSGRNPEFLVPFFEGYSFGVPVVSYNGAVLYDMDAGKLVSEHFMTGVTMDKLYTILHEIEGAYRFSFFNKSGVIREDIAKDGIIDPSRIENLYKFAVSVTGEEADFVAARDRITEIMEDCVAVRSYANYIEVLNRGYTKGPSTHRLAKMVGADTLVCVGDYENDMDMVEQADIGYAVENAIPALKAVADRITVSVKDAAIARIIEEL